MTELLADIAWFLFLWTLLSIVVAPIIGRLLKRSRRSQSIAHEVPLFHYQRKPKAL